MVRDLFSNGQHIKQDNSHPGTRTVGKNRQAVSGNSRTRLVQPTLAEGVLDHLGATVEAEFLADTHFVGLDGLDAQAEAGGDFLIAVTPSQAGENFLFSAAEIGGHRLAPRRAPGQLPGQGLGGEGSLEMNAALCHRANRLNQLLARRALEDIAGGAGLAQKAQVTFVFVGGQGDDLDLRLRGL